MLCFLLHLVDSTGWNLWTKCVISACALEHCVTSSIMHFVYIHVLWLN